MIRGWTRIVTAVVVLVAAGSIASACARDGTHRDDSGTLPANVDVRCVTDADCRLFSDYCDGCACRALVVGEAEPSCKGTIVQCFADPCQAKHAACNAGTCTVR